MYALQKLKKDVASSLGCNENELSKPPEGSGDISCSAAFRLAKEQKKNPKQIADGFAKSLKKPAMISDARSSGPYVNFFIDYDKFADNVLSESAKKDYGSSDYGAKRVITIDYSHPNICKPLHIGHLRSTIIGNSLYKMFEYIGFKPFGENYLGDWGLQFGKLIYAFKEWGNERDLKKDPIDYLVKLYIQFHEKENEDLTKKAEGWFVKLENGDKEAVELWERFRDLSVKKFKETYERLNVEFDSYNGEAFYAKSSDEVIKEAIGKNVAFEEKEGTVVVPLEKHGLTNARLLESRRTLYITRDIAAAKYRKKQYKFYKNLYIVSSSQNLNFQQLFKTLELLGYDWSRDCEHVKFGMFSLPEGKISTRSGQFILLEDVLDKAVEKAEKIISEKNPSLKDKKKASEIIGIGAVKFADLSQNRIKDVVFDLDKMVSFDGDTGPYLQYAYVRCKSILEKAGKVKKSSSVPLEKDERKMIMRLAEFPDAVMQSAVHYEPHVLANYLTSLVHDYSAFYEKCKVIGSDNEAFRLKIVESTANVLKIGLGLLGIGVIEEM